MPRSVGLPLTLSLSKGEREWIRHHISADEYVGFASPKLQDPSLSDPQGTGQLNTESGYLGCAVNMVPLLPSLHRQPERQ